MRLALILSVLILASTAARAAAPPVDAFAAVPQTSGVKMSATGRLLAWCVTNADSTNIVVFDTSTQKYLRTFPISKDASFRWLRWVDEQTLFVSVRVLGRFRYSYVEEPAPLYLGRAMVLDIATGKSRNLVMPEGPREKPHDFAVVSWHTKQPGHILVSTSLSFGGDQLYDMDVHTGKSTLLETGGAAPDWLVNREGVPIARVDSSSPNDFVIQLKGPSGWSDLRPRQRIAEWTDRPWVMGWTPDDSAMVLAVTEGQAHRVLRKMPLDGSAESLFFEDPELEVSDLVWDPDTDVPTGIVLGGLEEPIRFLDPKLEARQKKIDAPFPGKRVRAVSQVGDRLVARVSGLSSPAAYYLIDLAKQTANVVGEEYPALAGAALGEVRSMEYAAQDGARVPAYLTLPPGSSGKNLPLIVLPHDGPEARDDVEFDWLAQFIASRGYAVLQPQYRGSTGFGEAWRKAGHQQWGGLMQQDLIDGVSALAKEGIVDAQRVCIVGIGYGGYAALVGATFPPKIFRCAVSINGVSNLPAWLSAVPMQWRGFYWRENVGSRLDKRVREKSPWQAVADASIPILLLHAEEDIHVPYKQSKGMAYQLGLYGKAVKLVKLDDDGHDLGKLGSRMRVLVELESFLATHLH